MKKLLTTAVAAAVAATAIVPAVAGEITLERTTIGCVDPAVLLDPATATRLADEHQAALSEAVEGDWTKLKQPEFHRCHYFSGREEKFGPHRYWTSNLPPPSVLAGKKAIDVTGGVTPYWIITE
jgi:hypothetical protein